MSDGEEKSQIALGFLTVLEHDQQGLVGGYLILNPAGRPLEFHCTAPVKPSRAQQILFGPTLAPYLYGEQIGQTLVAKGSLQPLAICTDVEQVLSARNFVELPLALVLAAELAEVATASLATGWRVDQPQRAAPHLHAFELGRNRLAVAAERQQDRSTIVERLESLADFDLSEPFARIREAVEEAHKVTRV